MTDVTVDLLLIAGSVLLAIVTGRLTGYHRAFFISAFVSAAAWSWLRLGDHVSAWSSVAVIVAVFLGGLTATALDTGIAEDNAAPSDAVRQHIKAAHRDARLSFPSEPAGKRAFDIVLASLTILVTLPLWLLIAMLIWLEEPGPVLFVKHSVGRGGVTFRQFKFRSMRHRAEEMTGPIVSCPGDPRTLRVGRRLRRWHLDELPELVNVLAGSMSLVGPRPLRAVLVQDDLHLVPGFPERHTVRPGIACTAQIERYRMPPAERLAKDRAYIARMSLRTDIAMLWRAVSTTLRGVRDRTEAVNRRPWRAMSQPDSAEPDAVIVLNPPRSASVRHRDSRRRRVVRRKPLPTVSPADSPSVSRFRR
jgi:lipopolysaccharide/colanic/teichoic acid biosynthesis glycosyltransferase